MSIDKIYALIRWHSIHCFLGESLSLSPSAWLPKKNSESLSPSPKTRALHPCNTDILHAFNSTQTFSGQVKEEMGFRIVTNQGKENRFTHSSTLAERLYRFSWNQSKD
jgi:hypothetical protein